MGCILSVSFFQKQLSDLAKSWWFPLLLSLIFIPIWMESPLLFHTLAEFFSIAIALLTLVVAWNTFVLSHNHYLMWLGIGYFGVGLIDGAHALTFKGMPFVEEGDQNTTLQYWIIARYFEAIILACAPLYIRPLVNRIHVFFVIISLASLLMLLVPLGIFPPMFVEGEGLTPIKIINEWIIVGILVIAGIANFMAREHLESTRVKLILAAIVFTILAELMFMIYIDMFGVSIVVGHLFKIFSFWAIYHALIESSLREPFKALSRGANTYDAIPEEISLVDQLGVVRQVNKAVCHTIKQPQEDCLGYSCHELQHNPELKPEECPVCRSIAAHRTIQGYRFYQSETGRWYEISLSPIVFGNHQAGMVHTRRDVTEEKVAQDRVEALNRLYTVQTYSNKAIIGAVSKEAMFKELCEIAVEQGEFLMAWVGMVRHDMIVPVASYGDDDGYLESSIMKVDDSELARGPVGMAAKSGRVKYVNNTAEDLSFMPWREKALERDYQALAAVPILSDGFAIGVFTIYSKNPDVFDSELVELLSGLGADLSSALVVIEKEQRRKEVEQELRSLSQAVEQSANAILITNTDSRIEYVNKSFSRLTGYGQQEIIGQTPAILRSNETPKGLIEEIWNELKTSGEWHGKIQNRRKNGSLYWSQQAIFCIRNDQGEVVRYVSTSEDQTELHEAQETIKKLAFYDPLTQLPNRRLLSDRFQQEFMRYERNQDGCLATFLLDLDNFKTVNDSLGHNVGDSLLKRVATILKNCVRQQDTVARLGGDEFAIIISGASIERLTDIADSIVRSLSEPMELEGRTVQVGASVGIALYPQDADTSDELLRNADLAMYHAKSQGKNNFQYYRDDLNTKAHDRLLLENRIRSAIDKEYFQLYYQPQVDLASGEVIGLEALIRWIDPDRGVISPAEFIPLAEDTGMIGRIGDWVIETACKEVQKIHAAGLQGIKVAVNVSAHQFRKGEHLCEVIQNSLAKYELDPQYLSLELTESILIEDINGTIKSLNDLKGLNITLAVDDFGTGYSSLSYLKSFPIDVLKIDQTFIRDILVDDSDKAIVTAIIAMAKQLDLHVLAEGVETKEHNDFLKDYNCDYAQGYFYCKPIPVDDLIARYT